MELTQENLQRIRYLNLIIEHHKELISNLETELHRLVQNEAGVDLEKDNYDLNLSTGVLYASEHTAD